MAAEVLHPATVSRASDSRRVSTQPGAPTTQRELAIMAPPLARLVACLSFCLLLRAVAPQVPESLAGPPDAALQPAEAASVATPANVSTAAELGPAAAGGATPTADGLVVAQSEEGGLGALEPGRVRLTLHLNDGGGTAFYKKPFDLNPANAHYCDTAENTPDTGKPGNWKVHSFNMWLDENAEKTLKAFGSRCTAADVGLVLYTNEYCGGFPADDKGSYYRYNAKPGANGAYYAINTPGGLDIKSLRPSVLLPCSGGNSWTSARAGEPTDNPDTSAIGIKVVLWPGPPSQGQLPYIQHKCMKDTTHNSLLLNQPEPFKNYPIAQCIPPTKPTTYSCNDLQPGCASGADRVYCVGLKPWNSNPANGVMEATKRDVIGSENYGYDFANAAYIKGLFPGGTAMVNFYTDTPPFTRAADEFSLCAPRLPLHMPGKSTCVLTRFYAPNPSGPGCGDFWASRDTSGKPLTRVKSAKEDKALMLIGCGITAGSKLRCIDYNEGPSAGVPGGRWGVAYAFKSWPAHVYCVVTRTVDARDPDCRFLLNGRGLGGRGLRDVTAAGLDD